MGSQLQDNQADWLRRSYARQVFANVDALHQGLPLPYPQHEGAARQLWRHAQLVVWVRLVLTFCAGTIGFFAGTDVLGAGGTLTLAGVLLSFFAGCLTGLAVFFLVTVIDGWRVHRRFFRS